MTHAEIPRVSGRFPLFLAPSVDLDHGDLDWENGLEDLDRPFRRFFDWKVPLDWERDRLFL